MYVRPMVAWRSWKLALNVVWIASHHLKMARYRLRVKAKVRRVDALLKIGDTQEFAKTTMLRRHAAAFKIGASPLPPRLPSTPDTHPSHPQTQLHTSLPDTLKLPPLHVHTIFNLNHLCRLQDDVLQGSYHRLQHTISTHTNTFSSLPFLPPLSFPFPHVAIYPLSSPLFFFSSRPSLLFQPLYHRAWLQSPSTACYHGQARILASVGRRHEISSPDQRLSGAETV